MIKDSGARREFETGAVRDIQEGKGRMDLLPWAAIMEVAKHCEAGAVKYGEHNVDKGLPLHSFMDSAARHLAKFMDGQTDEPHLVAAAWNILWGIQMTLHHPELVDVPWEDEAEDYPAEILTLRIQEEAAENPDGPLGTAWSQFCTRMGEASKGALEVLRAYADSQNQ